MTSISNENSVLCTMAHFSCARCCVLRQVFFFLGAAVISTLRLSVFIPIRQVRVVIKLIDKLIGLGPVYYRTLNPPLIAPHLPLLLSRITTYIFPFRGGHTHFRVVSECVRAKSRMAQPSWCWVGLVALDIYGGNPILIQLRCIRCCNFDP